MLCSALGPESLSSIAVSHQCSPRPSCRGEQEILVFEWQDPNTQQNNNTAGESRPQGFKKPPTIFKTFIKNLKDIFWGTTATILKCLAYKGYKVSKKEGSCHKRGGDSPRLHSHRRSEKPSQERQETIYSLTLAKSGRQLKGFRGWLGFVASDP